MRQFSCCAITLLAFLTLRAPHAYSQSRINDQDLENLMRNVKDDAKSFQSSFNSAVGKTTIRKTSREKDAKNLVATFQKQTEAMLNNFKQTKKGETDVQNVMGTAQQVNQLVYELKLGPTTTSEWEKIQSELQQISNAFGLASPQNPRGISPSGPDASAANAPPCVQAAGPERAKKLVDECLAVSPATHPPCNVQNSCILIIDEIKRGCSMLREGAPAFCSEYSSTGTGMQTDARTITCASESGNRRYCDADVRRGVQLIGSGAAPRARKAIRGITMFTAFGLTMGAKPIFRFFDCLICRRFCRMSAGFSTQMSCM